MTDGRPSFEPLALEESEERAAASGIPRILANPNVFRVLLHHPPVADIFARLVTAVVLDGDLEPRLRRLEQTETDPWVRFELSRQPPSPAGYEFTGELPF